jgi:hypothetical protein
MKKLIVVVAALAAMTAYAKDEKMGPRVALTDLKWESPMGPDGPQFAFVSGDMKAKGPVSYYIKFTPGADAGWHTHDSTYEAVVVKGTMTAQAQGEAAEKLLPAGTYFGEPGKKNHRNACTKDGECILFIRTEKGVTFHPMTPEGKPAPAMAAAPKAEAPKAEAPKAEEKKPEMKK